MIAIDQRWYDADGLAWRVVQVHRKDNLVALQGPRARPRYASFAVLGQDYTPEAQR